MAITKRSDKGSALTYNEMDDNFDAIAPRTSATGSVQIPAGDTASRDGAPVAGYFRYNTSTNAFEGYQNGAWQGIGGVGSGDVNQSAFSYVTVAGQTTVSADTATDTLEIIAGTNVTITTNATNDSITINSSGTGDQDFAYSSLTGVPSSFPPSAHNQAWSTITATPTTLAGYGITDGATGVQGLQGVEGPEGLQGSDGDIGAQGTNGIGISGQQGVQGDTGAGTQGTTGATGLGTQGFQGTDGTQGTLGTSGDPGDLGAQGIQGAAGSVQGLQGTQGDTGPIGNDGEGFQGAQGLQGAQSTQGIQGGDGPAGFGAQGIQGLQGDLGPAGVGSQGVQGLIGPQSDVQGIQGTDGDIGTQGVQGLIGPASDVQGAQGATGVGDTGQQGVQGVQGISIIGDPGFQGTQGLQGSQGIQGIQGLTGFGEAGTQGTAGEDGAQGISGVEGVGLQGFQGIQGVQGFTGTGIQGVQGIQGSQGVQGDEGFQGNFGPQGTTGLGAAGIQGTQGTFGLQGTQSVQGLIGPTGVQGTQGTTGIQGFTGIQGLQSIQGLQGIDNGVSYASFSAVNAVPAGEGTLGYNNTTGVFEYTPAVLGTAAAVDIGVTTGTIPLAEDVVLIDANNNVSIAGDVSLGDNNKLIFGAGSDLQIYHDGSNSYIKDAGTGDLILNVNNFRLKNAADSEIYLYAQDGGGVNLYHTGNAIKLATTATGIDVTGTVTADGLTVDGEILLDSTTQAFLKLDRGSAASHYALTRYYTAGTEEWRTGTHNDDTSDFHIGSPTTKNVSITQGGDISFYESTGTTPKFFWDASAENLGVGTTVVDSLLHLQKSDATAYSSTATDGQVGVGPTIYLENPANSNATVGGQIVFGMRSTEEQARIGATGGTAPALTFGTADLERMRLDSAGNLLVGKTTTAFGTVGIRLEGPNGKIESTRNNNIVMALNRLATDGDIATFAKDSVTVGSWASRANVVSSIILDPRANESGFGIGTTNSTSLVPTINTGALVDGTKDLGEAATQWRNLHLSGGVVFGDAGGSGTNTSNTLDSYEEGTWTPTVNGDSTGVVTTGASGSMYTKVGDMVTLYGSFRVTTNFTGNVVGGFPFTVSVGGAASSYISGGIVLCSASNGVSISLGDTLSMRFHNNQNVSDPHSPSTTNDYYRFQFQYRTDQ